MLTDYAANNPPPVFTELLELTTYSDGFQEWKEIARWIKYEETVEVEGNRWSKPHVSTPKLQGWLQLRHFMHHGLLCLDLDCASSLDGILTQICNCLVDENYISDENAILLKELWMQKHRHQFEGPRKVEGNLSTVIRDLLVQKLESKVRNQCKHKVHFES